MVRPQGCIWEDARQKIVTVGAKSSGQHEVERLMNAASARYVKMDMYMACVQCNAMQYAAYAYAIQ